MSTFLQDIRHGARILWKRPGFAIVAVLTLALGIGANTAVFSVVNAVMLQPLPYDDPDRLALIRISFKGQEFLPSISPPEIVDFREQSRQFEAFEALWAGTSGLTGDGDPEQIQIGFVSGGLLPMLGVDPIVGRHFNAEEAAPNGPPVVMIGFGLWQRRFGADPGIIGRTIDLDGRPSTVVGVTPPGFQIHLPRESGVPRELDVMRPIQFDLRQGGRSAHFIRVIGKLKPGVAWAEAQTEMDAIARRLFEQHSEYASTGLEFHAVPLHADLVSGMRPIVPVLLGAVGFVLLISSANVANLLLARAGAREKEIAIRAALGAGRWRIARQLLTECLVLSVAGGAAGLLLARWSLDSLLLLSPANLPGLDAVGLDGRVLGFSLAISVLTAVLCGLAPALQASRVDLSEPLKEGGRTGGGVAPHRLRSALVIAEIALSLVLLVGAGLMIRSFVTLQRVRPGFTADGVTTLYVSLPFSRYGQPGDVFRFQRSLLERIEAIPGVKSAGGIFPLPLSGRFWTQEYAHDTRTEQEWGSLAADQHVVLPGYFAAMGTRLLAGRVFDWSDNDPDRRIVIVDAKMANKTWPGENPIGKRLKIQINNNAREWLEVVGMVEHVRQEDLAHDSREQIYLMPALSPFWEMPITVKSTIDPEAVVAGVRSEVGRLDANLPVHRVRPMRGYVGDALARDRFTMILMGIFAGLAALLASIGLYGVISQMVGQRRHEIGIRVALGANRRDIFRLVVGQGMALTLIGIGIGVGGALALVGVMSRLLFEISATDPVTYVGVALLLAGVALLACWIPARGACRVDPMIALRYE